MLLQNAWLRVVRPSDDICTTTGVGHRAERLNVAIPSNDRVSFTIPIVPLKTGNTSLIVQLLTSVGVDQLEKQLFVKVSICDFELSLPGVFLAAM